MVAVGSTGDFLLCFFRLDAFFVFVGDCFFVCAGGEVVGSMRYDQNMVSEWPGVLFLLPHGRHTESSAQFFFKGERLVHTAWLRSLSSALRNVVGH